MPLEFLLGIQIKPGSPSGEVCRACGRWKVNQKATSLHPGALPLTDGGLNLISLARITLFLACACVGACVHPLDPVELGQFSLFSQYFNRLSQCCPIELLGCQLTLLCCPTELPELPRLSWAAERT